MDPRHLISLISYVVQLTLKIEVDFVLRRLHNWLSVGLDTLLLVIGPFWLLDLAFGILCRSTSPLLLPSKSSRVVLRLTSSPPPFLNLFLSSAYKVVLAIIDTLIVIIIIIIIIKVLPQ